MRQRVIPMLAPLTKPSRTADDCRQTKSRGMAVLRSPALNKGAAFSEDERSELGLTGLLPPGISTLEAQVQRAYSRYEALPDALRKNIYLATLRDRNEVLLYRLFSAHLQEMIPIVNDLTADFARDMYHHECRPHLGVYLSINHADAIEETFTNLGLAADEVDLVIATDAEQMPRIGDWGAGGIEASIRKLAISTAAGGVDPARAIPVMLDVGINGESASEDPAYIANSHTQTRGEQYDAFIESYVSVVTRLYPNALLQWEDFAPGNGRRILAKYRDRICTFNDNLQGTGAIILAAVISAVRVCAAPLSHQHVVIFGAGTAGIGAAEKLRKAMVREGLTNDEASRRFWCVDRQGLLTTEMGSRLGDHQTTFARRPSAYKGWKRDGPQGSISLAEVVRRVKPTILIGASTVAGAFTEEIVRQMAAHVERPIIFALSNPRACAEARPTDLIAWTEGRALIATGASFAPVTFRGVTYVIAQVNNAMLYPGLALGAIVSRASRITDGIIAAAAAAVSSMVVVRQPGASLLPHADDLRSVSTTVAVAVAEAAVESCLARVKFTDIVQQVQDAIWQPVYRGLQAS